MSAIGNWLWGTSQLDDAVDKATSELLPAGSEDIALNLEICDQIRSKSVAAKDAMRALKRRLNHKNPNVQNLALGLTDICVKNGGDHFLVEIASREFMDNLVSILKIPALNLEVKNNILRLVQNWSVAVEGKPTLSYMGTVYKTLTNEGFQFPPKDLAVANSAMLDTSTAPEWIDSEVCLRCRTAFTFTNRKHHCRNCGLVFDQACSSKSMPLPHFGITQDVRVCEGCHSKLTKKPEKADKGHRHSASMHGTRHHSARELADAELQRAIQLSLQEVGAANGHARPGYVPAQPSPSTWQHSEPPIVDRTSRPTPQAADEEEDDPDLKAAIEASLREANAPKPSAPIALEVPPADSSYTGPGYSQSYPPAVLPAPPAQPSYELEPLESDAILTFSQTIEQVEAQGGRDISRYPAVNELYDKANSLRPKLALSLDDAGRKEQMLSDMHDKLSQAVKLYDKLLTEQVAFPRWRSQAAVSPPVAGYQKQASSSYNAGYSHSQQWASSVQTGYQTEQARQQQPQSPQMSYSSPPPPPAQDQHTQYGTQQQQSSQRQQFGQYNQYADPNQPLAQTSQQQPAQLPPVTLNLHQYPYYHPPSTSSPPLQATPSPPSVLAPTSPPTQYSAPPLQPTTIVTPPSSSPALSRHKTLSYAQPPPGLPSANAHAHMARSNTLTSYAAQQARIRQQTLQRQQPQQLQHQQQFQQAPSGLPQFPVAPTSTPQAFPLYGPSGVPVGIGEAEAPERKEALLIDL